MRGFALAFRETHTEERYVKMSEQPQLPKNPPAKVHGVAHVFAAARYSYGGFRVLWGETAFRHEVLLGFMMLAITAAFGASLLQLVIGLLLVLVTLAVEALNTAIEVLVDHISPDYSEMAKHAKDLGSFAVFCLLVANGVYFAYVLASTLFGIA